MLFFPHDFRDADGRWRSLMPGDFAPVLYRMQDEAWLCASCLNSSPFDPLTTVYPDWRIGGYLLHYDGPPLWCHSCHTLIPSLYGDEED